MAEINWTPEQEEAIITREKDILVSAAAGSGKTAVLIERLLRRITDKDDPLDVNKMLLVTFTEEAANQLKNKIRDALSKAIAHDPSDKRLRRQYLLLSSATITTIHGFCLNLIKKNYATLALSPNIRVSDPIQSSLLKKQVAEFIIDAYYSSLPGYDDIDDFVSFADNFITLHDSSLSEILLSIYDKLLEYPDGIEFLNHSLMLYDNAENSFETSIWADTLFSKMKREFTFYESVLMDACEAFTDNGPFQKAYLSKFESSYNLCRTIIKLVEDRNIDEVSSTLKSGIFKESGGGGVSKDLQDNEFLFYKDVRKEFRDATEYYYNEFFVSSAQTIKDTAKLSKKAISNLYSFIKAFDNKYSKEKKSRGIIDFSDFMHMAYSLLIDKEGKSTELAIKLGNEYDVVCIDEYQDVNKLQDDIFSAISKNTERFMVGDIKQCIYGFRGSQPKIFADYRNDDQICTIDLNANFRCDSPIIKCANEISSKLFSSYGKTFEYKKTDDLVFGKNKSGDLPVEIIGIDESIAEPDKKGAQARYVAQRIKAEIERGVRPSDIAILMRTKTNFDDYEKELAKLGIKAKNAETPDLFVNPDVILLMCILQTIDNPSKDIYLTGALKSPVYNFTLSELAKIRKAHKGSSLYESLCAYVEANDFKKGQFFLQKLKEYRSMMNEPVDKLIWHILNDSGLLITASDNGNGKKNLMALYNYARNFENGTFKGLYNFIRYINDMIESGGSLPSPKELDDDVVKIMSVHKSKGLEFETVLLCGTEHLFSSKEKSNAILMTQRLGASLKLTDSSGLASYDTIFRKISCIDIDEERDDEEIRVLYVALTRARSKLIITANIKGDEAIKKMQLSSRYINDASGYVFSRSPSEIKWIIMSNKTVPVTLLSANDVPESCDFNTNSENSSQIIPDYKNDEVLALADEFRTRFEFVYPHKEACKIPAKLSVSRLYPSILDEYDEAVDMNTVTNAVIKKPAFIKNEDRKGSDIGTATHLFMQFCSFENLISNGIENEIKRLTDCAYIDLNTASLISRRAISGFLKSQTFNNLRLAKDVKRELRFNVRLNAADFTENEQKNSELSGESVFVQGIIDCLYTDNNDLLTVLDYKTDFIPKELSEKEAEEMIIERHFQQLSYYAAAAKIITGKCVDRVVLYSFSLGKEIDIPKNKLLTL